MARNEVKLRRQLIDDATLEKHRNYSLLLRQHHVVKKKKRVRRFFIFTLLIAVITVLILVLFSYLALKWEKKNEPQKKKNPQATEGFKKN